MLFKLHYFLTFAGLCAAYILLGVYLDTYTDASTVEIGAAFMVMPLLSIISRPAICSMADRAQAYRRYLIGCQLVVAASYAPFVLIPFLGPRVYERHPRYCWYILVVLKTVGDLAMGGVASIGDTLAINYAKRVGADFSVYRIWGTLSWMSFGLVIGWVNEVWFLPKYVAGFLILIGSSLLNMLLLWLWPDEYFRMVSGEEEEVGGAKPASLLPRELVWAQAKGKLLGLVCLGAKATSQPAPEKPAAGGQQQPKPRPKQISRATQFRILALLVRRDPRIVLCVLFFVGAGLTCSGPVPFLFLNLSEMCHLEGRCDFSQLAGCLQASMAGIEVFLFLYMPEIKALMGRLNLACFAVFLMLLKYCFYATLWATVDPYYAIIVESIHGTAFGIYLTLMVEFAHVFAQEVELILPELVARRVVGPESEPESIKVSLSATMQALICSAYDGLGKGFGALLYGFLAKSYSYQHLWRVVALETLVCFCSILVAIMVGRLFELRLGPKPAAKTEAGA